MIEQALVEVATPGRQRAPLSRGAFLFYRCVPDIRIMGAGVGIGAKAALLGGGATGPVLLHVGGFMYEPTAGATYEPTEGATTEPIEGAYVACASAAELVSASAVANAIVMSFMVLLLPSR